MSYRPGDTGDHQAIMPLHERRDHVSSNGGADRPTRLTGWGRTAPSLARVRRPLTDEHVREQLRSAGPRGALPRGLGRSYGDAAQNAGGTVLDTANLKGVRAADLETGVVTVGAGTSVGDMIEWFLPHGWFPPVVPGTRHVTVGGAVASDIHGKNHHADGSWGRHVERLTLATPHADLTVGPDDRPEVFWATVGGMGLTGVVLDATVELRPVETSSILAEDQRTHDFDATLQLLAEDDHRHTYSVAWVDCSAPAARGRSVVSRGEHARCEDLSGGGTRAGGGGDPALTGIPEWWSWRVLNRGLLRAFNEAWYRLAPATPRTNTVSLGRFFFPLDAVDGWNRLYGSAGFLQYQFVVPFGREDVLRAIVEESTSRTVVYLAVLKRFGPGTPGMLSFPIPGWTLAMDIPVGAPDLADLLDRWDEHVATAGGRLYLAKDSRTRAATIAAMYPELSHWRRIRSELDPDLTLRSDLSRRVELDEKTEGIST